MNDPTSARRKDEPGGPPRDEPVGTPPLGRGDTLTCRREIYTLTDEFDRTWIAVGPDHPPFPGGVMSHLRTGQTATVVSSNAEGLVLRLRGSGPQELDQDVPAYLLPSPLVPTFETDRSDSAPAATTP